MLQGMLGCGASARKDGSRVSGTAVGQGKTTQWKLPALDHSTTACICFDICAEKAVEKTSQEVCIIANLTAVISPVLGPKKGLLLYFTSSVVKQPNPEKLLTTEKLKWSYSPEM